MRKDGLWALALAAGLTASAGGAQEQALYGIDPMADELVSIDPVTGEQTSVGPLGIDVQQTGADFGCGGVFWAFSGDGSDPSRGLLYTVDLATGAASVVQTFTLPGGARDVGFEFGPDGATPYWRAGGTLSVLDIASGTVIPHSTQPGGGPSLALAPSCDRFLAAFGTELTAIDPSTGAQTTIGPTGIGGVPAFITSLAAGPGGEIFAVSATPALYSLDPITGFGALVAILDRATPGTAFGPYGIHSVPPEAMASLELVLPVAPVPALPPASPSSVCSASASARFVVVCSAVDNCDAAPAVAAELVATNHDVVGGACEERIDRVPVACGDSVTIELLAAPCAAKPPSSPLEASSVGSDGVRVVRGESVLLEVRAVDACGNVGLAVFDPALDPSPGCEIVLDDGTCCPPLAAPAPPSCPVSACAVP